MGERLAGTGFYPEGDGILFRHLCFVQPSSDDETLTIYTQLTKDGIAEQSIYLTKDTERSVDVKTCLLTPKQLRKLADELEANLRHIKQFYNKDLNIDDML